MIRLQFVFIDVGQGQVISEQERQTVVFIFYMQRPAHILRILVHEAKDALILASHRLDRFKLEAKRFPLPSDKCNFAILSLNRCAAADVRHALN